MKKTLMKVFAIVMCAFVLVTCFAGCKKKDAETFVIGATGPLTGDAASYGLSVQKGAELAIEQINANGGLNGIKFDFQMVDDEAKADKVSSAYDTLKSKGMQASIGSVTSGACLQFASVSAEDNLFFITPSASSADVIEQSNAYRVCFGDPDQGYLAAENLVKTYNKIGVIYNSDDAYSSGVFEAFESKMGDLNKTFVKKPFTSTTKTNFAEQVTALKAENCDVVFLPIYYQEAWLIIQEAETQGYKVPFFGCDGLDGLAEYSENSPLVSGVKYLTPFDVASKDEKVSAFVKAFETKYGTKPDQFAADGYDAVMVIYEAMKAADIKDVNISASDLCDKIKAVINGDFTYVGATGSMTWDASGAPTKAPNIVTIG